MRILIATGLYPPDIGGPATYTTFLEKHASKLGLSLIVVPFTGVRSYPPGIRHLYYLTKLIWNSRGCDVIYALDTISVGVPALIASVITRKPLMLRVPGDYAWEQGQQRFGVTETLDEYQTHTEHAFPVRVLAWLQRIVAQHAIHIVVPSDYMRGVVARWGISEKKITRVYSALKVFGVEENASRSRVAEETFVIATAARLVPWKGVDALIDAVVMLREAGVPAVLRVMGDGVSRASLEEHVRAVGADEYVEFLGAIPRDILSREIQKADAFVLNTSYEGLSHQLIEVMSLGVPIITTPVGGNPELICHEETGLMVPWNDVGAISAALMRLYRDRTLGETLSKKAIDIVPLFHEDRAAEAFGALIHTVWKS